MFFLKNLFPNNVLLGYGANWVTLKTAKTTNPRSQLCKAYLVQIGPIKHYFTLNRSFLNDIAYVGHIYPIMNFIVIRLDSRLPKVFPRSQCTHLYV